MKNLPSKFISVNILATILSALLLSGTTALTDPTRPPDALIPDAKKLKLSGSLQVTAIYIYPDRRFAIINNQIVNPGDQIGEYTITNIQHDTVELKGSEDKTMILPLTPKVKAAVN